MLMKRLSMALWILVSFLVAQARQADFIQVNSTHLIKTANRTIFSAPISGAGAVKARRANDHLYLEKR
jgi:hypothetical protein